MRKVKETDPLSAGFKMLARRPYSVAEFRRALERKCGATAAVHEAVNHLRQLGYLDDKKFAEQTAYSLAQNRAFGPYRVRRELKAKLVNYKFIDSAVAGCVGPNARSRKLRASRIGASAAPKFPR